MSTRPGGGHRPGAWLDSLVHPVPLAALALLVFNDHVLKATHPGWLSGKLSDVAVLALLPFVVLAAADLVALAVHRLPRFGARAVLAAVIGSAALFAAIEITPLGAEAYRWGLALAQWPVHAVAAFIGDTPLPGLRPVMLTADVSDLLTIPAAATILIVMRRLPQATTPAIGHP
jgi:hypothetical protein